MALPLGVLPAAGWSFWLGLAGFGLAAFALYRAITSGGFGPSVDHPVALGLIPVECRDQNLFADVRGRKVEMEPAKLPFVPHQYKK